MINYLIGKLADKMENYSNFVEFSRLEGISLNFIQIEVIKVLNKKLKDLDVKVYELLKLLILCKLDVNKE